MFALYCNLLFYVTCFYPEVELLNNQYGYSSPAFSQLPVTVSTSVGDKRERRVRFTVPRQAVAAVRRPDLGKGAACKRVGGGPQFPSVDFSKVHKYSDRPLL